MAARLVTEFGALVCLLPFYFLPPASSPGAEPELSRFTFTQPHMGTEFKIIVYAANQAEADKATQAAFERIAELDRIMSDYRPTSELMRLCQKAGGEPVKVSEDLFFVLSQAEEASRLSNGAFDVTVGPLVKLWRLSFRSQRLPDKEKLAKALDLSGYKKVHLDAKARTVKLDKAGMQLDLGGIAKGYAADEALAVLKKLGITRALVAASGDIAVSGPPADADGWSIAIAPLDKSSGKPEKTLLLHDAAVSTSGDAEKYVEIHGKRYSHIVDPRTGLGLTDRMSVTVVADHGITADSMTKVVCVLGPEKGMPLIDKVKGAAAYMVRQSQQGVETFASKEFKDRFGRK
ncbi:MAG: FAD:protein FMN transferase [Gemmataceae bacterium]